MANNACAFETGGGIKAKGFTNGFPKGFPNGFPKGFHYPKGNICGYI